MRIHVRRLSDEHSRSGPGGEGGSFLRSLFAAPSPVSDRLPAAGLLAVSLSLSAVLVVLLTAFAVV
jgi:hypothetical protein